MTGKTLRPIVTNLNGDNSWILSIPRPPAYQNPKAFEGKLYFHVAIDPWFGQGANAVHDALLHMKLPSAARIAITGAVESTIAQIEASAGNPNSASRHADDNPPQGSIHATSVDAIVISFTAGDHCHPPTLRSFPGQTGVFAVPAAAKMVQALKHFETVVAIKSFDGKEEGGSWSAAHPGDPLPTWLSVFDLPASGPANFALAIITSAFASDEQRPELIVFTPHGIAPTTPSLHALLHGAMPPVRPLALMHPLKEYWNFGIKSVLGGCNGLALGREIRPRYWVKTGDGTLLLSGVISWFGKDVARTLKWALEEDEKAGIKGNGAEEMPQFVEVDNGGQFVLA